jgi:hypothetical protein
MFDVRKFLAFHNIEIREKGHNVGKGNINVCCPFCIKSGRGDDDFHMGINLTTLVYGCWRDSVHRGRKIERLVRALIDCSYEEANTIVHGVALLEETDFASLTKNLWNENNEEQETKKNIKKDLIFPKDFVNICPSGLTSRFYSYLQSRGFDDVSLLIKKYELRCCLSGKWKNRVIIPLFFEGELVSWTGRSLYDDAFLRYQDLSVEESIIHPKQFLLNYDNLLKGGEILFVCEGPFDALKVDFYMPESHRSTCLFTKAMTENQLYLLRNLSKVFKCVKILLDEDALSSSINIAGELAFLKNVEFLSLPDEIKDPGNLTKQQVLCLM